MISLPLIIVSGFALLTGGLLLLTTNSHEKKAISLRLQGIFSHQKNSRTASVQNAFTAKHTVKGWRLRKLIIQDRIDGVGGFRALSPFIVLALASCALTHYVTTPYGALVAISASAGAFGLIVFSGYAWLENKLRKQFNENLPLAIDLVVRAVSAGVALPASFQHVADSIHGKVGQEFQLLYDSVQIGMPLRDSLEQAVRRIPSPEFHYFAIILSLSIDTGGKLSESLGNLSEKLRARRQMARKVLAMTAEPRMSAFIVALFPFAFLLILYLMNRNQFFFLFTDDTGRSLLGYTGISTVIGFLQLYRMTRIS